MSYFPDNYEYDQSPEANLLRRQIRLEEERQKQRERAAEDLIASLRPEDATRPLFTFDEIRFWGLKHTRKRAVEPPQDGA